MREDAVAALRDLVESLEAMDRPTADTPSPYVDWHALFGSEDEAEEWLAWPLIPAKRQGSIYSPAKVGKSLVMLDVAASVATGKPILGQPNLNGPRHVMYLDFEMTAADLLERLEEMGYEADELDHLHYALLPELPPLNKPEGGRVVRQMAADVKAELVIVDTLSRVVEGDVFHPTVIGDFYTYTGMLLKADGRALWRLDHEGKEAAKGQIGSSMKATDVDVVWHLARTDNGLRLTRKYSRIMWGPNEIDVAIDREPLRHTIAPRGFTAGTGECAALLESLGADAGTSTRAAQALLKANETPRARVVVVDAMRQIRARDGLDALVNQHGRARSGGSEPPESPISEPREGTSNGHCPLPGGTIARTTENHQISAPHGWVPSLRGNHPWSTEPLTRDNSTEEELESLFGDD